MKLVVGLGNPGRKYEATRHNAGFWWIERLARAVHGEFRHEARFHGDVAKVATPGGELWLLKPATFMNQSGRAVAALAGFYKLAPGQLLIVHDELDLPPGTVRLKKGGGTGGHNGLNDIAAQLGTKDFWRLRIGIGHPRNQTATEQEVLDYVLHKPGAVDHAAIDDAISRGLEVWPLIAEDKLEAAMLRLHTKPEKS
ncbi:MAG: aminoacyl-tRNA hydrolase [Betaproteobacteria bacterium RIFCSPLOWO2_02_64_14]|nr:MAG: aminoacyl-tRNA hydrolase [Betaproteobacteria bacterium RIFCSPLOWO2_02_64_14]